MFCITSNNEEDTRQIAKTIASFFRPGDLVILDGELGAGKTYFVKGFSEGLQSADPVSSPTFSIANFYRTPFADILHIDLYRIATVDELNDLGLFDYFGQSIVLIEWGMKMADSFEDYLLVTFTIEDDNTRILTFDSHGAKYDMNELKNILKGDSLC